MIITIPGLLHELMGRFDVALCGSLITQGFLWPTWPTERLASSGSARISLTSGKTVREFEPDAGLQILTQKFPFLIVEVADSQQYGDTLEKAAWMLKYSKGKIRFAILIKLQRKARDGYPGGCEKGRAAWNKHMLSDYDDNTLSDSSPPAKQIKRVRTQEPSSPLSKTDGAIFDGTGCGDGLSEELPAIIDIPQSPPVESVEVDHSLTADVIIPYDPLLDVISPDSPTTTATVTAATSTFSSALSSSPSSPSPPHNPRAVFSTASVTVLGSTLTGSHRDVTTLLACTEF